MRTPTLNYNVLTLRKTPYESVKVLVSVMLKIRQGNGTRTRTRDLPPCAYQSLRSSRCALGCETGGSSHLHPVRVTRLRGKSTLMISAPNCLYSKTPKLNPPLYLTRACVRGEEVTTYLSSCPAKGPAMSCSSSKTRSSDNRRLLDLSFGDEYDDESVSLAATSSLPITVSGFGYGYDSSV